VAVKEFHQKIEPKLMNKIRAEANIGMKLRHPNIVQVARATINLKITFLSTTF
jgi:hypothetical protein